MTDTTNTGTSPAIAVCDNCAQPVAVLRGPSRISDACGNQTIEPVLISASSSFSPSGRPFKSVAWEVETPAGYSVPAGESNNLNTTFDTQAQTVELTNAVMDADAMVNGVYTFRVTVTTFLDQSSTASINIRKQPSGVTPSIAITTPSEAKIKDGVVLSADVSVSSVCPGSQVISPFPLFY